jgi:hypothetical protein
MAALYRYGGDKLIRPLPLWLPFVIYLAGLLCGLGSLVTSAIDLYRMIRRERKTPFAAVLASFKNDLDSDADFLARLWAFDKPTLAYAFVQYSHRWNVLDGRQAVIAGDIRKLGLFPALAAAAMSAATLLKEDSMFVLWAPLILACCFYVIASWIVPLRERPAQVVALLKYAIEHADHFPKNASVPEAKTEASPVPAIPTPEPVRALPQGEPTSLAGVHPSTR